MRGSRGRCSSTSLLPRSTPRSSSLPSTRCTGIELWTGRSSVPSPGARHRLDPRSPLHPLAGHQHHRRDVSSTASRRRWRAPTPRARYATPRSGPSLRSAKRSPARSTSGDLPRVPAQRTARSRPQRHPGAPGPGRCRGSIPVSSPRKVRATASLLDKVYSVSALPLRMRTRVIDHRQPLVLPDTTSGGEQWRLLARDLPNATGSTRSRRSRWSRRSAWWAPSSAGGENAGSITADRLAARPGPRSVRCGRDPHARCRSPQAQSRADHEELVSRIARRARASLDPDEVIARNGRGAGRRSRSDRVPATTGLDRRHTARGLRMGRAGHHRRSARGSRRCRRAPGGRDGSYRRRTDVHATLASRRAAVARVGCVR